MFFTIPSSSNDILVNTPIQARAITHVFFENKNDSIFNYKKSLEKISISIDGKQICRDLVMLPFCTSSPFGENKFKWQDVALEVNINVDFSEIKISGVKNNDFNIVFVYTDKIINEIKGFDFVETKKFALKDSITKEQAITAVSELINENKTNIETFRASAETAYNNYLTRLAQYQIDYATWQQQVNEHAQWLQRYNEYQAQRQAYEAYQQAYQEWENNGSVGEAPAEVEQPAEFTEQEPNFGNEPQEPAVVLPYNERTDKPIAKIEIGGNLYSYSNPRNLPRLYSLYAQHNQSGDLLFSRELQMHFDHEPQAIFAYAIITESANDSIINSDIKLNFSLYGADNEIFPDKTDLELISVSEKIPFRKAVFQFDNNVGIKRSLSIKIDQNERNYISKKVASNKMGAFDIYLFFIYKKII